MGAAKRTKRTVICIRCQNLKRHEARGLCKCCYNHVREGRSGRDTLDDYPTKGKEREVKTREPLIPQTSTNRSSTFRHHKPGFDGYTISKTQSERWQQETHENRR